MFRRTPTYNIASIDRKITLTKDLDSRWPDQSPVDTRIPWTFRKHSAPEYIQTVTQGRLAIAAIYNAGAYRMSTWVPFLWGLIQALVVIMGSYSTVTTIL
ncbi:hypothetical protein BGZ97_000759 [Linnemannia gamsii]|uniref:Uncharacterized protein n=1 Tax=Linnemannia gamsii TaxID=64522 RepID=A0A9P6QXM4_9FUNG|nr:hypothetical protein BGZ97_000759 [Linnemannia gamsii]